MFGLQEPFVCSEAIYLIILTQLADITDKNTKKLAKTYFVSFYFHIL